MAEEKQTNIKNLLLHLKELYPNDFTILVVDKDTEQRAFEAYRKSDSKMAEERERRRQDNLRGLERAHSIIIG